MNRTMTNLEEQFTDLRIHVDKEVNYLKEATSINQSNIENVHSEMEDHETKMGVMMSQIDDCINNILDIKSTLADGSTTYDGGVNATKIQDLQKYVDEQFQNM